MGGHGSGKWYRYNRRSTVEESLVLDVGDFFGKRKKSGGTIRWNFPDKTMSAEFEVFADDAPPKLVIGYLTPRQEVVAFPIRLQTTPTQFGGMRFWFTCPLILNDIACERRVGKLYLPGGARYFGCRHCYRLTYDSCQQAHVEERSLAWLCSLKNRAALS